MIRLQQTADGWTVEADGTVIELRRMDVVSRADYEFLLHGSISNDLALEMTATAVAKEREQMRLRCEEVVAERFYRERWHCHDARDYEVVREEIRACVDAIKALGGSHGER